MLIIREIAGVIADTATYFHGTANVGKYRERNVFMETAYIYLW